ncbi:sodium:proton antiporter NhaD [Thalassotalea sp. PS06]|uniref:sodium:proton antiporter NhaD n=1 Tax=Thalassotalea sp. PS06 TaxID=2594005 RepID=UPI0011635061|nr:sodium:proton antiporter NhaD [Thalassotalea sp. PS06]QDP00780.1 sodium:proton antiporter [Thalassotalea sp. PS06]
MLDYFLIFLAILALLSIVFEEITHVNKAKTTLFLGCVAWMLLFINAGAGSERINHQLEENLLEIAILWLFLMSTMTFVAYLNAQGIIQAAIQKVFPARISQRKLMLSIAGFALVLSSFCDNVTATLVSLALLQSFDLPRAVRIKMAVLVVFAVNSGGVALITGDVTTLMIFLEKHVEISQLLMLFLPAIISVLLLALVFSIGVEGDVVTEQDEHNFSVVELVISAIFISTILLTMALNILYGVPPVLTFLTGLATMFLAGRFMQKDRQRPPMLDYIRRIEYDTLLFFLGILLLVGMLKEIGILTLLAEAYAQYSPGVSSYFAGIGSALVDNVPLTAALLKAQPELSTAQWLSLTYAVGVGGSLLVIGSAAGIIAMSKLSELTFMSYLKYAPALLIAYTAGYLITMWLANALYATGG